MKPDSTPEDLHSLVDLAMQGDKDAIGRVCAIAGRALQAGEAMHPAVLAYVAGSLARRGHGSSFHVAFSPLDRVSPETTKTRSRMQSMSLVYWVDHAIARQGLTTSRDGDPGPAFEHVAESFGLSPATVRNRYYEAKKAGIPDFRESCKKR